MSAWNSAGTFEEKDISGLVHERLRAVIEDAGNQADFFGGKGLEVAIKVSGSITGEGSLIFTRGKKKFGFELQVKLDVTARDKEKNKQALKGTAKFESVTREEYQNEADCEAVYTLTESSSAYASAKKETQKHIHPYLCKCIDIIIEEFQK